MIVFSANHFEPLTCLSHIPRAAVNSTWPPVVEYMGQEERKGCCPVFSTGTQSCGGNKGSASSQPLGTVLQADRALSPLCRLRAHLLSGAVSDRPHEPRDGCQHLQILYHVRPPRGLWAFCCQHESWCGHVVQQTPPNICQRAQGSSTDRGMLHVHIVGGPGRAGGPRHWAPTDVPVTAGSCLSPRPGCPQSPPCQTPELSLQAP